MLTVQINHKGGTIQNAFLNAYPVEIDSTNKFQLLSDKAGELFQAQSGLLPQGQMPTHHSIFSSDNTDYQLSGETLTVPFKWKGDNGIEVVKNFHFKRDSYVVTVDYIVTNNSNNELTLTSYTQLVRNALDQSNMMMPTFTGGARYDDQDVYEKIEFDDFSTEPKTTSKGGWIAIIQHYFFAAWIPDSNNIHSYSSSVRNGNYLLTTVNPNVSIAPGATATLPSNNLYIA